MSERWISSSVELKASISHGGRSLMNPTVSENKNAPPRGPSPLLVIVNNVEKN
jgi:hypothetical protein